MQHGRAGSAKQFADMDAHDFESFFALYGGVQLCEDLEALANWSAHTTNRARSKLEPSQQAELDACLAALGPICSAPLPHGAGVVGLDAAAARDASAQHAVEVLEQRFAPLQFLAQDSCTRALGYKELLLATLEQLLSNPDGQARAEPDGGPPLTEDDLLQGAGEAHGAGSTVHKTGTQQGDGAGLVKEDKVTIHQDKQDPEDKEAPSDKEDGEGVGATEGGAQDGPGKELLCVLHGLQANSAKRISELAAAALQLLLDSGNSLVAPARTSAPTITVAVAWPSAASSAHVLRHHATCMLHDLVKVTHAYLAAVDALLQAAPAHTTTPAALEDELAEALLFARTVKQQLVSAHSSCVDSLNEAYRGLLFVLVLRELVLHIAAPGVLATAE